MTEDLGETPPPTAIVNALVYCVDPAFTCHEPGTVVFRDGIITDVGPSGQVEIPDDAEIVDGKGRMALLPGFIDTHSHSSLLKGYSEDAQLLDWLPEYQREHQVLTPDDAYFACLVSYMEALKGGTTTVLDMYRHLHRGADAAEAVGLRAHLVPYAADHPTKDFFETLDTTEQLIKDRHGTQNGRITVWIGLEHLTYCSEDMFHRSRELADKYGVRIHTHASEQKEEEEAVLEMYGGRTVEVFNDRGILTPGSVLAHCVWVSESDIEIMADTGTGVAHCPLSNMKLAGGAAPLQRMHDAGITIGLGSDGAISNNSLSMWESMKTASLLQKVTTLDATAISARRAIEMATIEGARLLGVDAEVGSIEVGKQADLITVDLWQPHLLPLARAEGHDPVLWNLVFAARASDVDSVWVQGRRCVQDGHLTMLDESAALDEIHHATVDLLERRKSAPAIPMF